MSETIEIISSDGNSIEETKTELESQMRDISFEKSLRFISDESETDQMLDEISFKRSEKSATRANGSSEGFGSEKSASKSNQQKPNFSNFKYSSYKGHDCHGNEAMAEIFDLKKKREKEREKSKERKCKKEREKAKEEKMKLLQEKKWRQREKNATNGKYSHEEICCVFDSVWLNCLTEADRLEILDAGTSEISEKEKFSVFQEKASIKGLIRWTHRSVLHGGACPSLSEKNVTEISSVCLLAIESKEFCDFLEISFENFEKWVEKILRRIEPNRLILLLQGTAEELSKRTNAAYDDGDSKRRCIGEEKAKEFLVKLFVGKNVEYKLTVNCQETRQFIWDVTRSLSKMPYHSPLTGLQTVQRVVSFDSENDSEANVFVRQLMMIPGVSEAKAKCIQSEFKSVRGLLDRLTDPGEEDPSLVLVNALGKRNEVALSKVVHKFYTATDPYEKLH